MGVFVERIENNAMQTNRAAGNGVRNCSMVNV